MKDIINRNFSYASKTYDKVAATQLQIAEDLVNFLTSKVEISNFNNILDIGTGTGFIPKILSEYIKNGNYYLNDISLEMLKVAKNKLSNLQIHLLHGDIENNQEFFNQKYDLIISNMSLQWIENLSDLLKKMISNCKIIAFTTLGIRTFSHIRELYIEEQLTPPTKIYSSIDEFQNFIHSIVGQNFDPNTVNIAFQEKEYFLEMKNFRDYIDYTRKLGVNINMNPGQSQSPTKQIIKNENPFLLNYHTLFVTILRK